MRKIKNFKISIRTREVSRIVKRLLNVEDLDIEVEEAAQQSCFVCEKIIRPAVVYDTFSKESMFFNIDIEKPEKWIAVSPYVLTIGSVLQEQYEKSKNLFGNYAVQIISAISTDALEQSKNFIQKIINSEMTREDNCELSRSIEIPQQYNQEIIKYLPI